ncbi:2OG-Fe(II) oxygenase [Acrasis kona]|uniref:2OG-Fe(II) oxygenase n=1 Tax=Acrasis kona TaxID=1008807 RepID=A0AAW2YJP2_9EUKA
MERTSEMPPILLKMNNTVTEKKSRSYDIGGIEYCISGVGEVVQPDLKVDGVPIKIPLDSQTVSNLIKMSNVAYVGLGNETVIDTSIRQGYNINASRIAYTPTLPVYGRGEEVNGINQNIWKALLHKKDRHNIISNKIKESFHKGDISIKPYKLLVYEKDQFFKLHRDTQRGPNHFASIVLFLPGAKYTGGELVVRRDGNEMKYDYGSADALRWVCFHIDCEHEVLPITSGHRVTMTFHVYSRNHFQPGNQAIETVLSDGLDELSHIDVIFEK